MSAENLIQGIRKMIGAQITAELGALNNFEEAKPYRQNGKQVTQNAEKLNFS